MVMPNEKTSDDNRVTLTRRQFVRTGGTLFVGFSLVGADAWKNPVRAAGDTNTLDPTLPASWVEVHADNTVLVRTGKPDFGQSSVTTAYRQVVAEELRTSFDAVTTVIMGDTDRTPDGGGAFAYLAGGAMNLRKVAAYTYQALLDMAATRLGVPKDQLSVADGVVTGRGQSVTYGQLVDGQELSLSIPVSGTLTDMFGLTVLGDPPLKPTSEYTIIGKSFNNFVTESKVAAKETWATDVRLPNMLHGRVVHPKTLGSTLVSAGEVDVGRFPNAKVVVTGNLVGVVAPAEWEAIGASQQVAADTEWTDWSGLPGSDKLFTWMREEADWSTTPVSTSESSKGSVPTALAAAATKLAATYELPFKKHAPIGPTVAVADVRSDGVVYVYTHNQNPQALRGQIALMLGTSVDNVVVRSFAGPGHYGRSNGGNAGAEDEAVILSRAVGRPVRVQWMRPDDIQWSTSSPPGFSNVQVALDGHGKISGFEIDHHMPAMQDDRLIGALIAGLPTMPAPDVNPAPGTIGSTVNRLMDPWVYGRVPNLAERGHGTFQIGQKASPLAIGLRDHSMRTPGQFQQNFPREMAMSEAASLAGIDPIQFRIDNTDDERLINVLETVRRESGWTNRPSPSPTAVPAGSTPTRGQGVSAMLRQETYWACVCRVSVAPDTGQVTVDEYTIAVEPGIVVNPAQLKRQVEGGAVMGMSHALHEEMTFDESSVTSRNWRDYPIMTMAEVPPIKVIIIDRPDVGSYGGGSEAANAVAASAIAAAFFDATGRAVRRLPLKPAYVKTLLQA